MIMIKKSLLSVLLAASPAMAGEFGLNRAEIPALREIPVAEAPQPAPTEKLFEPTAICRDAFVNMINGAPEGTAPELRRVLEGINTADQSACRMEFTYVESQDKRGNIYVYVPDSVMNPFNHYVPASNEAPSCSAGAAAVWARHSWTQDSGWHHKFTTELAIKRLPEGLLEVTYGQGKGAKLTCVGRIAEKRSRINDRGLDLHNALIAGSVEFVNLKGPEVNAAARTLFRSAGFYRDRQQAGLAMLAAAKALKKAGADVVSAEVDAYWGGLYYFELAFISEHALSSHTSAAYFYDEKEARESLRQMAALLADGDRTIVAAELTRNDRGFAYTITALEGVAPAPAYEE